MREAAAGLTQTQDLRGVDSDPEAERRLDRHADEVWRYWQEHTDRELWEYVQTVVRCSRARLRGWLKRQAWYGAMRRKKQGLRTKGGRHKAFVIDQLSREERVLTQVKQPAWEGTPSKHPVRRWAEMSQAERRVVEERLRGRVGA